MNALIKPNKSFSGCELIMFCAACKHLVVLAATVTDQVCVDLQVVAEADQTYLATVVAFTNGTGSYILTNVAQQVYSYISRSAHIPSGQDCENTYLVTNVRHTPVSFFQSLTSDRICHEGVTDKRLRNCN